MGGMLDYAPSAFSLASGQLGSFAARAKGKAEKRAAYVNAGQIERESAMRASRLRTAGRQEIGAQRAALGASGLQAVGSPLDLLAENAAELERRAMEETLAGQYNAAVTRMGGDEARKQARRVSAASLLSGAGQAVYYGRSLG